MENTINLQISFESLIQAIRSLDLDAKYQLLANLEQQIFEAEEELHEDDEGAVAEIEAVQDEYDQGEYMNINDYVQANQSEAL